MERFVLLVVVLLVAVAVVEVLRRYGAGGSKGPWPYRARTRVISPAEIEFLRALDQAVGQLNRSSGVALKICAQMPLRQVVEVARGTGNRLTWQNKINQKVIDFVLIDRETFAPRVLVELDDSSHQRAERQKRDADVDRIAAAAGLPIVHVRAGRSYSPAAVAAQLNEAMSPPAGSDHHSGPPL